MLVELKIYSHFITSLYLLPYGQAQIFQTTCYLIE